MTGFMATFMHNGASDCVFMPESTAGMDAVFTKSLVSSNAYKLNKSSALNQLMHLDVLPVPFWLCCRAWPVVPDSSTTSSLPCLASYIRQFDHVEGQLRYQKVDEVFWIRCLELAQIAQILLFSRAIVCERSAKSGTIHPTDNFILNLPQISSPLPFSCRLFTL